MKIEVQKKKTRKFSQKQKSEKTEDKNITNKVGYTIFGLKSKV